MSNFKGIYQLRNGLSITPFLTSVSVAALLFTAAPAAAQSSDISLEDDEIVVTARKREESVLDVPLSISAFSAEDIKQKGIQELEDVALLTPGLTFEDFSNGGFGTPVIRGATQFDITSLEQNVATFIDGVYVPRAYSVDIGTDSLERIEVVKGPQSALYGANAFTGAINYITRKADLEETYGGASLTVGDNNRFDISGEFSFPLIQDKLAIKLDAKHTEFDGDWDNDHPAADTFEGQGSPGNLGGWDNQSYGASLIFQPTDRVNIDLGYRNIQKDVESRAQTRLERGSGDLNCGALVFGSASAFCGELPDTPRIPGTETETGVAVDPRSFSETETEIYRGALSVDITDAINASYQFANISADIFAPGSADRDPTVGTVPFFPPGLPPANFFTIAPLGGFDYDSHEVRLDFTSDNGIYAMIGGFYSDGEDVDQTVGGFAAPIFTDSIAPITPEDVPIGDGTLIETETTAIFAQLDVPLFVEGLSLSAEGRFAWEDITGSDTTGEFVFEDNYFVPRVSLDYKTQNGQLFYASVARGVKSGGVNGAVVPSAPFFGAPLLPLTEEERFFDQDRNTTFEIGTKSSFLDNRVQLNAAAYYIDWSDLQISVAAEGATATTAVITSNIGSASSKGIEIDGSFDVTENFTLNGGFTVLDATYDDDIVSQRIVRAGICDGVVCTDGQIGGNDLPRSSDFQWNIGAQYDGQISSKLDYFIRGDLVGQSDQFVSELNLATIPSRALLNLRAGLSSGPVSADFWITNVTDEEYVANAFYIPNPFFVSYVPTFGNRRRLGVTLNYEFD